MKIKLKNEQCQNVFGLPRFSFKDCSTQTAWTSQADDHALMHDLRMISLCFTAIICTKRCMINVTNLLVWLVTNNTLQNISQYSIRRLDSTIAQKKHRPIISNKESTMYWNSPTGDAQLYSVERTWVSSSSYAEALSQYSLHWIWDVPRGTSV